MIGVTECQSVHINWYVNDRRDISDWIIRCGPGNNRRDSNPRQSWGTGAGGREEEEKKSRVRGNKRERWGERIRRGGIFLPSALKAESGPRLAEREGGGGARVLCQTSDNPPKALRCVCTRECERKTDRECDKEIQRDSVITEVYASLQIL